jgi:hypothetical protein
MESVRQATRQSTNLVIASLHIFGILLVHGRLGYVDSQPEAVTWSGRATVVRKDQCSSTITLKPWHVPIMRCTGANRPPRFITFCDKLGGETAKGIACAIC